MKIPKVNKKKFIPVESNRETRYGASKAIPVDNRPYGQRTTMKGDRGNFSVNDWPTKK